MNGLTRLAYDLFACSPADLVRMRTISGLCLPNEGPAPRHYACPGCGEPMSGPQIGRPCGPCAMEVDHLTAR
jgi:hypothetical protein